MTSTEFVYTTYIKTTPEKVWAAITTPEFCRQYWGVALQSDWKKGSKWEAVSTDEKRAVTVSGEILEAAPPKRLVMSWSNFGDPDKAMPPSRVTFEIDMVGDMVRLNVLHDKLKPGSETVRRISDGWPRVLSSMKSFLETGKPLDTWAGRDLECGGKPAKGAAA